MSSFLQIRHELDPRPDYIHWLAQRFWFIKLLMYSGLLTWFGLSMLWWLGGRPARAWQNEALSTQTQIVQMTDRQADLERRVAGTEATQTEQGGKLNKLDTDMAVVLDRSGAHTELLVSILVGIVLLVIVGVIDIVIFRGKKG